MIAANRTRHPLDARTLARLAAQYAGRGVVGFGLSNDERRGEALSFAKAFEIAERAGLLAAPHAGELCGPESVWSCLDGLRARRIGHGVRSIEDPQLVAHLADEGITCEVCPTSNVALGVYPDLAAVPLRKLYDAGVPDRARRRRPAVVRDPAARPVRGRPRRPGLRRRGPGRAGPDVDPRLLRTARRQAAPSRRRRHLARHTAPLSGRRLPLSARAAKADHSAVAKPDHSAATWPLAGGQRAQLRRVGSGWRTIPKVARTPSRISGASASRSAVVAEPRLVSARVCLVERRTRSLP